MHFSTSKVAILVAALSTSLVSAATDFSSIPPCVLELAQYAFMEAGCFTTDVKCICREAPNYLPRLIPEAEAACGVSAVEEALGDLEEICKEEGCPIATTYSIEPTPTGHISFTTWHVPTPWPHPIPTTIAPEPTATTPAEPTPTVYVTVTVPCGNSGVATSGPPSSTAASNSSSPPLTNNAGHGYGVGGGKASLLSAAVALAWALLL